MKKIAIILCAFALAACGKPGDMSDADYAKYKDFGAPKVLYSCSIETSGTTFESIETCSKIVNKDEMASCLQKATSKENKTFTTSAYLVGVGAQATYNELLEEAKGRCKGTFKILDKKE